MLNSWAFNETGNFWEVSGVCKKADDSPAVSQLDPPSEIASSSSTLSTRLVIIVACSIYILFMTYCWYVSLLSSDHCLPVHIWLLSAVRSYMAVGRSSEYPILYLCPMFNLTYKMAWSSAIKHLIIAPDPLLFGMENAYSIAIFAYFCEMHWKSEILTALVTSYAVLLFSAPLYQNAINKTNECFY